MDYEARMQQYQLSVSREEAAAACAQTPESARLHHALSAMYRHEAAKMDSVRKTLRITFGRVAPIAIVTART